MPDTVSLTEFQKLVNEYVLEREWKKYHKPKDVAISISIEASELLELFQWRPDPIESGKLDCPLRSRLGEEIADIVIYCICMANALDLNLSDALLHKMEKNRTKYPVEKVSNSEDWDEVRSSCRRSSEKDGDG